MLLRIDFFYSMSLSLNSDKTKRREMKKSFIQMPEWSLLVDILISFHAFPSIFFFWGTAEVLQSHIENLQTLISTEITHQRLLPLNWRPDSECIWFSLSFLDYNTRLQIKPYMLQWHIILCLNVWGLFTLVPIQLNFSVLCNLCNRLKIWSHMIV